MTLAERFWSKVDQRGPDDCWPWLGTLTDEGYGVLKVDGRNVYAHRLAFVLAGGVLAPGVPLDHRCHDERCPGGPTCPHRACENAAHIQRSTIAENVLRGSGLTAVYARRSTCVHGHPLDGRRRRGQRVGRYCKTCNRDRGRVVRAA